MPRQIHEEIYNPIEDTSGAVIYRRKEEVMEQIQETNRTTIGISKTGEKDFTFKYDGSETVLILALFVIFAALSRWPLKR